LILLFLIGKISKKAFALCFGERNLVAGLSFSAKEKLPPTFTFSLK
jgi:hypothetical protein